MKFLKTTKWLCTALAAILAAAPALAADPFASDWSPSLKSSARLIAGQNGVGVEIKLAPGTITYWRDPGDAGVPPTFDFSGSSNLAKAEPLFPAPSRIEEPGGVQAFGYQKGVVFPIAVTPRDPASPVKLALKLNYAACEKICVPAQATLSLGLLAQSANSPYDAALDAARMAVPRAADAAASGALTALDAKRWRYCLAGTAARDLFVEPPQGWWIAAKADAEPGCFALELKLSPDGAALPVAARLTITGGDGPLEANVTLAAKP